jgi:uncharacterized protein YceH (UPF0502 family)
MSVTMNEIERRVFGVLLEKALAQPQYYPMTVNAILAACNQKNNREPAMELDEDAVWNTLEVLRAGGLVSRLLPGGASRVERFKHEAKERFGWEKPQRAVMAELLLRGPQTVGELRTRCGRMYPFDNTESVAAVLDGLAQGEQVWVTLLPRAPGQSAARYAHTLYEAAEQAKVGAENPSVSEVVRAPGEPAARSAPLVVDGLAELRSELNVLRSGLDELRARIAALEASR